MIGSHGDLVAHANISGAVIEGYAFSASEPLTPRPVTILIDNHPFATLLAADIVNIVEFTRHPLYEAINRGRGPVTDLAVGFRYVMGPYLPRDRTLNVRVKAGDVEILNQSIHLGISSEAALSARRAGALLGKLGVTGVEKGVAIAAGVVALPDEAVPICITADGEQIQATATRIETPAGRCTASRWWHMRAELRQKGPLWVAPQSSSTSVPPCPAAGVFLPADWQSQYARWKFPEDHQVVRVAATNSGAPYYFGGGQTRRLVGMLAEKHGDGYSKRILDWGCGCGRVAQHLLEDESLSVTGIDIDPENVEWCRRNLTRGKFSTVGLFPPTEFKNESFDLAFAISVLTHLTEDAMDKWLEEMQRLIRPDGLLLVTIHSVHSLLEVAGGVKHYEALTTKGIDDTVIGGALVDVLSADDMSYYRETFHSHDYVLERFSRWFDVVAIYEGLHFNYQDYVVMRRRATAPRPLVVSAEEAFREK